MANYDWWRSWHGAPTDLKYKVVEARTGVKAGIVSAIVWALFDYASQNNPRGSVEGFDVEIYSVFSGFTEDEINTVIAMLGVKDVIENGRLVNWDKRQPKSEEKIERVREWRKEKSNVPDDTNCYTTLPTVTESYTEKIREDKNREDKELKDVVVVRPNIFRVYEQEIGALTGRIGELLKDALTVYSEDWIIEALQESARQNKRSWSYAEAILKRRKAEGTATIKTHSNGHKPRVQVDDAVQKMLDEVRNGKAK